MERSRFAGSGLGLSIVRTIVEMMGGKVHIVSTDTGTRIWFDVWMDVVDPRLRQRSQRSLTEVAEEDHSTEIASSPRYDSTDGWESPSSPRPWPHSGPNPVSNATLLSSRQTPELTSGAATPPLLPSEVEALKARDRPRRLSRSMSSLLQAPLRDSPTPSALPSPIGNTTTTSEPLSPSSTSTSTSTPTTIPTPTPALSSPANPAPQGHPSGATPTSSFEFSLESRLPSSSRLVSTSTLAKSSGPSSAPPKKLGKSTGMHPTLGRPVRVLVVEDNHLIQRMTQKMLMSAGFEVLVASDGKEALGIFEERSVEWFDVCLMDLCMPVMDGMECITEIRKRGWTLPVVALTANATDADRTKCLENGFNYFVGKPFQLPALLSFLKSIFTPPPSETP
ncbi:hypothetical protein HDV00_004940 [Rhizophlyctis rosea]|nr:hypothetical protein HDV00_004940 [Rhizophlyctis rosea]